MYYVVDRKVARVVSLQLHIKRLTYSTCVV